MMSLSSASEEKFDSSESGAITELGLFLFASCLLIGSYAIDVGNLATSLTQLQVATDATAHAALLRREFLSASDAKTAALEVAELNMPEERYGYIVDEQEIEFGEWDAEDRVFTVSATSKNAVRVRARRDDDTGHQVETFLFKLVGIDGFDIVRESIFVTYHPTCFREGFVAQSLVDLQSNNSYLNGFCIHSNAHVSLNSNNYFEPGTVVSMPDTSQIDLPNSGYETNEGLEAALRSGSYHIRIISQLERIIDGLEAFNDRYLPDYITSAVPRGLTNRNIYQSNLLPGSLHYYYCGNGGSALTFKNDVVVEDIVLITDCKIKYEAGVVVKNSIIATRNTDAHSMTSSSGLQLGENDDCASGGGTQLITLGSVDFPADLKVYGSQILAKHDISFSANADGIEGAAFVAGGEISGTSNMSMGFCGTGMESNFHAEYFRMVL